MTATPHTVPGYTLRAAPERRWVGASPGMWSLPNPLTELNQRLAHEQSRVAAALERADAADRRARVTADEVVRSQLQPFIVDVLAVRDVLAQALTSGAEAGTFAQGIQMTLAMLDSALERQGIRSVEPGVGDPLNPAYHEAVCTIPRPDLPPGCVGAVMRPGFTRNGALLRPAAVAVVVSPA